MKLILLTILSISFQLAFAQTNTSCVEENIEYINTDSELRNKLNQLGFKGKNFFLSGEVHTIWESVNLRFEFINILHETYKVNHLILETGISRAYLINRYLETGKEDYLTQVYPSSDQLVINKRNKITADAFREIYKQASSSEAESKIRVIGVDIERNGLDVIETTRKELIEKETGNEQVRTLLKDFWNKLDGKTPEKELKLATKKLQRNSEIQKYLSINITYEKWLIKRMIDGLVFKLENKPYRQRDVFMYESFVSYHKIKEEKIKEKKYYYQIGVTHLNTSKGYFADFLLHKEETGNTVNSFLTRFDYVEFKTNIYGDKFKRRDIFKLGVKIKDINEIVGDNKKIMINLKKCEKTEIDYSLLIVK